MTEQTTDALLEAAKQGIDAFLNSAREKNQIDQQAYDQAVGAVFPELKKWMTDKEIAAHASHVHDGLRRVISENRPEDWEAWESLVNAYRQPIQFGTGGIRGMMAFDFQSIEKLNERGVTAPILKGPNTINEIVLLRTSTGVAQYGQQQNPPLRKVVVGYDSRIRGQDFAKIVAQLFLNYDYTVYFFDEACPYPEMTFAIPHIKADIGILISASHNDYRYNGYKLSCSNGSQFDPEQRTEMFDTYIAKVRNQDIRWMDFSSLELKAPPGKLIFLGGDQKLDDFNYSDREVINIHKAHCDHVKSFLLTPDLAKQQANSDDPLCIAYCAFHGAGRRAVPRLLSEVGFRDVRIITADKLYELNGLFPAFEHAAGKEQQPDPGDIRAARTAVTAFKKQKDVGSFDEVDILIGTDPDADRCGVVVKVPKDQRDLTDGEDWDLLPADSMWALVLWYRFHREIEQHGRIQDADKKFIVLSHTTSDSVALLAQKHGLGVIKTWVGFAALAAAVRDVWEQKKIPELTEGRRSPYDELCHPFVCEYSDMTQGRRSINVAAMEQSNGFSILGGPPPDERSLGKGGHVRDKDGTLAALLVAEIAAWAKQQGTTIYELIDRHIHLDPDVGLFVTRYEPDPMDGEYPGIQGDRKKKNILRRALAYFQLALAGDMTIGGRQITDAVIYRTGKYDRKDSQGNVILPYDFHFPDEGIRFYLGTRFNHVTVRPSGTGNSLRFHIQLHEPKPGPELSDLVRHKKDLDQQTKAITDELRTILKAPK